MLHAHLVHGQAAPVKAGTPQASGQGAGAVAQERDFTADLWGAGHPSLLSHMSPTDAALHKSAPYRRE